MVICAHDESVHEAKVAIATLRWKEVGVYFTITAFVIFAALMKLGEYIAT